MRAFPELLRLFARTQYRLSVQREPDLADESSGYGRVPIGTICRRPKCRAVRAGAVESKVLLRLIFGLGSIISPMQDRGKISIRKRAALREATISCLQFVRTPALVSSLGDVFTGHPFVASVMDCCGVWRRGSEGSLSHPCMGSPRPFSNGVASSESYTSNTIHTCKPPAARYAP